MPITLEDRRDLVEGLVPLFLHVAWRLLQQGTPFADVFSYGVDIYRFTSLYDGKVMPYNAPSGWQDAQWDGILHELRLIFDRHAAEPTSEAFEHEGYQLLWPVLEPALARGVEQWRLESRPYGFFEYNLAEREELPDHAIELHFFNPSAPESPFADPPARLRELRRLVTDVRREHPEVIHAATGTWLNSFPPFLVFFPPEWAASANPSAAQFPGTGLWGQFYDRRGRFHRKNAEYYRQTGTFRYLPMNCRCRIETLHAYLDERLNTQYA